MTNSRTKRIYTLFFDYLHTGRLSLVDCIDIMEAFELDLDYAGAQGVRLALEDYVCLLALDNYS